ncbi:MAG TPA: SEC-C metal-binding domain-containing protein, partial [Gammaproteobacteria bacterium]|nr:SEC-C metal-binding domain-containing protein [Gammaproteobacteria bacterium]
ERISTLMQRFNMPEGEALEHPWISRAIENAQRKVEGHNFDIRKNLLEFDDVANEQRKVIYAQRNELMASDDISEVVKTIREDVISAAIDQYIPPESLDEQWDVPGLEQALEQDFGVKLDIQGWLTADEDLHEEPLRDRVHEEVEKMYAAKEEMAGAEVMRHFEKAVMLQVLDSMWKEHLASMDYLRQGIHLRGYAQKNPKQEYKREAFEMFTDLLDRIKAEVVRILTRVQVTAEEDVEAVQARRRPTTKVRYEHAEPEPLAADGEDEVPPAGGEEEAAKPFVREGRKVGRNEPCPCGSGKKYKQCHGRLA